VTIQWVDKPYSTPGGSLVMYFVSMVYAWVEGLGATAQWGRTTQMGNKPKEVRSS